MDNRKYNKSTTVKVKKSNVKDYGNDPFFVKKSNNSKAFLEEKGFPGDLIQKLKSRSM
ncbi:hypothetical protein [Sphingobacterium faecale]|uniref:Uncharacterized protein n=1 Tax=Sphingobacterium faecale TaxID=2803775 RepID=A0ABS1R147_9SPHI|nr:hypothetical protein [Sphingobacterium faecale]MBL1408195.1 hypothetical protein [Sphingobacterium faecale]